MEGKKFWTNIIDTMAADGCEIKGATMVLTYTPKLLQDQRQIR